MISHNEGQLHRSQRDQMMQNTTRKHKLLKMRDNPFVYKVVHEDKN